MTTSNNFPPEPATQGKRAFTLVELMIALGILIIALAVILPTFITFSKYLVSLGNYSEMSYDSRMAVELIARDVRGAEQLTTASSTAMVLVMPTDAGSETITYRYNASSGILFRSVVDASGTTTTNELLKDVTDFSLVYYNRLGNESTPASILTETKSVNLDAVMSRKVLQLKNTDNIISAKFMMRNAN